MTVPAPRLAIRAADIRKSFSMRLGLTHKEVLGGLSFEWTHGANYGLIGPNGSGKSTLQRILAGVDRPSSGDLEVLGGQLSSAKIRARVGYVPEDSPFPPELTPKAVMQLVGSLYGLKSKWILERSSGLLEKVGLAAHASKPLRSFSRGMLRRFALAQAWLHEPDLILLDEPTAGLDGQGFEVLAQLLDEARSRGATVVITSHMMSDLVEHCEEVFVLLNGTFAAQGAPGKLFSREGCWRIDAADLSHEKVRELEEWIHLNGGRVESLRPSGKSLFELYRERS